jgi:subtilisin family serine protease
MARTDIPRRDVLLEVARYLAGVRTSLLDRLAGSGFQVNETYESMNTLHATISTPAALKRVLSDPGVINVTGTREFGLETAESLPLIKQPAALATGNDGLGSTVVVIDTGVSAELYNSPGHPVILALDMTGNNDPWSDGHGAVVNQVVHAVAPAAKIISLKACQPPGCADELDGPSLARALQWVFTNYETYKPKALNLSVSTRTIYTGECSTPFTDFVTDMAAFDIVPVVASGNQGVKTGIADPSCGRDTLAVGAVYDASFGYSSYSAAGCADQASTAWRVGCFSNSGNMLDIVAPGCRIGIGSSGTSNSIYNCGTSLAAPHVTGAVAILRGITGAPWADALSIMTALVSTPFRVTDSANNLSRPGLDITGALTLARAIPRPPTPPGPETAAQTTATVLVPVLLSALLH